MAALVPEIARGTRLAFAQQLWGPLYETRLSLGGPLTTIAPIGDPLHANAARTTFASVGDQQVTWTPTNSGLHLWATPLDLRQDSSWQGIIPTITFDGSSDWIETPDASFWTDTADGTLPNEPSYTWIMWVSTVGGASIQVLWSKSSITDETGQDWSLFLDASERATIITVDDSENTSISSLYATALPASWTQFGVTKDTSASATGFTLYINGAVVATTDIATGSYTAQENGTGVVRIGAETDGGSPLSSTLAGAPLGPLFIPGTVLSTDAIKRDFEIGRRALTL